ncbi:SET and MYND domain-containing protein 4 [Habropoda laboriosa]|uniref:Protein-lysine N-methyltransferase SMYD4 n=1 Tax=Habropoda laboriosa TaxID=597456 RepID=A0A0L7RCT2_9HYME|nr:PREDICTED: SET and MYND domain-containing protein 4-like [Habropoda laboriosa]KOC68566.1 SET and MYND domain-containing protein 4 [Habropoda laboriosa]
MEIVLDALNAKIRAADKLKDIITKYKALQTDEERIIFTFNCMLEYDIIPEISDEMKDAKKSEKKREIANQLYIKMSLRTNSSIYVKILELYTESISYAPNPSIELALAYANRSVVLLKLRKYEECIQDIDRSLPMTNSDNLLAKLYVRKLECLVALQHPDTNNTIKETECLFKEMSLDDNYREKLNEKIISQYSKIQIPNKTSKMSITESSQVPLPEIKTYNVEFPSASDAIGVKYNEKYGRHVIASRNIDAGEVLVIEKPYTSLLTFENRHTHCSNCLEVCWALIPCDHCIYAMYCSEECKTSEWEKYHDMECAVVPHMLKLDFSKLDVLSLRLAVKNVKEATNIPDLREELKEVDNCNDSRTKGFSKNGTFPSEKYRSVLGLATNTEKRSVHDLFRRSLDSCFILYYLATCTNMFGTPLKKNWSELITNSNVTFVGSLILRYQQVVPTNANDFPEVYGIESRQRGCVIAPFASLMGHSCNANTVITCKSGHMIIHALYPIKEGEQIFSSYGPYYALATKALRQMKLLKQFYFECDCIACRENWPLYPYLMSYKNIVKKDEHWIKIHLTLRNFPKYFDILAEVNIMDRYIGEDLLRMIKVLHELVPFPCKEMCDVVETMKRFYDLNGARFDEPEL